LIRMTLYIIELNQSDSKQIYLSSKAVKIKLK
jgi:hypothetical protein